MVWRKKTVLEEKRFLFFDRVSKGEIMYMRQLNVIVNALTAFRTTWLTKRKLKRKRKGNENKNENKRNETKTEICAAV